MWSAESRPQRRRFVIAAAIGLVCALLAWWGLVPGDVAGVEGAGVARVEPRSPVAAARPQRAPAAAGTDAGGAWEICEAACPGHDPRCRLDCALDRVDSHPDEAAAWLVARIAAMRLGDEDLYRALLMRQRSEGPPASEADPWRTWGQFVAARAPGLQERALRALTTAGLHRGLAGHALGVRACGISGPDFVVCAP